MPRKKKEVRSGDPIRKFGITPRQKKTILYEQKQVCAICKKPQKKLGKALALDHDHVTGKPRGFLCDNCNMGLGGFQDDQRLLKAAIRYLNRPTIIPELEPNYTQEDYDRLCKNLPGVHKEFRSPSDGTYQYRKISPFEISVALQLQNQQN